MEKKIKVICLSLLILSLAACGTMKSEETTTKENKQISTAQLNAQLGLGYLERHEVQRAKQKLLLALSEAPNIPEPWYSMAYYLEVTGETEQAKTYYLKALALAPNRGDVQNNLGTFLCRTGDYRGSIQHFLLATKDPDYLDTASAYENAGLCASKIPDDKLALQYFNLAILQDPNHPISLFESAQLNYKLGKYGVAKQRLAQYLAISPATPQSKNLSILLSKKVNSDEGDDQFNLLHNHLPIAGANTIS